MHSASTETVQVRHVKVVVEKSFDVVRRSFEAAFPTFDIRKLSDLLARDAEAARRMIEEVSVLSIFELRDHGQVLGVLGQPARQAVQYDVGNPLTASKMTRREPAAALYAQFRVLVREDAKGRAIIEYDKPSSLFGQFADEHVKMVGQQLDEIIEAIIEHVAE